MGCFASNGGSGKEEELAAEIKIRWQPCLGWGHGDEELVALWWQEGDKDEDEEEEMVYFSLWGPRVEESKK